MSELKEQNVVEESIQAEKPKKVATSNWASFVETEVVDFFNRHEFEKMTIEDGDGNKAKINRQKDYSVKVETSSTIVI